VAAKGLLYLLIIGIVVFLAALALAALRMRRRSGGAYYRLWQAGHPGKPA
jgi:amino acid transporter